MHSVEETKKVLEAMKIAEIKAKNAENQQTDYDTLQALVAMYPETKTWTGHKFMNIVRTIKAQVKQ